MPELKAGMRIALTKPLKLRPAVKVGTRGTVQRSGAFWGLVTIQFDHEPQPCLTRADHVAPLDNVKEAV